MDEENSLAADHARFVRVSGDDDPDTGIRIDIEFLHVVQNVNADAAQLQVEPQRQLTGPSSAIIVPAHGLHRCDGAQSRDHRGFADVTGMYDALHPGKRLHRFRSKEPVSIRDQSDPVHPDHPMPEAGEPEQIRLMKRLIEMSAERSYMNGERTLSVWIRTALELMIFGIAIDRFGLMLRQMPSLQSHRSLSPHDLSTWGGGALIALGVVMALSTGTRFLVFAISHRRVHRLPAHHGPYLGPIFAALVALFGIALLFILSAFPG